jgi:hypothetical protein
MYSAMDDAALPAPGFPIRRSAGQRLFSASPRLIAAVHVLLRLLVPRHPPCALTLLTVSSIQARKPGWGDTLYLLAFVQFSSSAEADERGSPARGLSKLSSVRSAGTSTNARAPLRSGPVDVQEMPSELPGWGIRSALLPRKEVIQPQLPLRLPCYDFTPITGPTFDGCLP